MSARPSQRDAFVTIAVGAPDRPCAERAAAEAYAAGAVGLEEFSDTGRVDLVLYAPAPAAEAIRAALEDLPVVVGEAQPVPPIDWAEQWKADHRPVPISERLLVRPPFGEAPRREGRCTVVIDPGAAFGTGSHESTRLALEWIDVLAPELPVDGIVLDVGAGTGVLSLAAVALSPARALAFDLDPLASAATRDNARRNALQDRVRVFTGGIDALHAGARFDLIAANLLRRELEPILPDLARHAGPGAPIVLSGLLASERGRVEALAAECGLATVDLRTRCDASGEEWIALVMRPSSADANRR
jgi:ribosomal protein L11 methyltransferase